MWENEVTLCTKETQKSNAENIELILIAVPVGCSLRGVWCPPLQGCCPHHLPWPDLLHIHQDGKDDFVVSVTSSTMSEMRTIGVLYVHFFQKNDKTQELIEVAVKDLTFDQLQLLKVKIRQNVKHLQPGAESADSFIGQWSDPVRCTDKNCSAENRTFGTFPTSLKQCSG